MPDPIDNGTEKLIPPDKPQTRKSIVLDLIKQGLTQAQIARQEGISQAYVSEILKRERLKVNKAFIEPSNSNNKLDDIDLTKLTILEEKANNAPLLTLLPSAMEIWRKAVMGGSVKPESIRVAEKILKSCGVLDESANDDRMEYDALTTKELWDRMTRAAGILKLEKPASSL